MKKSLSLLVAIAMVFSMFASVAFAADAAQPSTQEKFDALKEQGIFSGYPDGSAGLDRNMTRAEFSKVLTLINSLKEDAAASTYKDVPANHWAKGFIGAVTKAELMNGVGANKFDPSGNVTIEAMATTLVRALDLEPVEGAEVAGASAWAAGYVQAAIDAKILPEASNYKVAAKRAQLVDATYAFVGGVVTVKSVDAVDAKTVKVTFSDDQVVTKQLDTALEVGKATKVSVEYNGKTYEVEVTYNAAAVTAKQTGAKKITLEFNKAVTKDLAIEVKYLSQTVTVTKTFADDLRSVVLTAGYLPAGDITVKAGDAEAVTVKTEAEKATKVTIGADSLQKANNQNLQVKTVNQFNEDMPYEAINVSAFNSSKGQTITVNKTTDGYSIDLADVTVGNVTTEIAKLDDVIVVSASNTLGQYDSKSFKVTSASAATKITIDAVQPLKDKTRISVASGENTGLVLPVTLTDQYGKTVKLPKTSAIKLDSSANGQTVWANNFQIGGIVFYVGGTGHINSIAVDDNGKVTFDAAVAGNVIISASNPQAVGANASISFTINEANAVKELKLSYPASIVVKGESVTIPFTAIDSYGAAMGNKDVTIDGSKVLLQSTVQFDGAPFVNAKGELVVKFKNAGNAVVQAVVNGLITSTISLKVEDTPTVKSIAGLKSDVLTTLEEKATLAVGNDKVQYVDSLGRTKDADASFTIAVKDGSSNIIKIVPGSKTIEAVAAGSKEVTITYAGVSTNVTFTVVKTADIKSYEIQSIGTVYGGKDSAGHAQTAGSVYAVQVKLNGKTESGTAVVLENAIADNVTSSDLSVLAVDSATKKVFGLKAGKSTVVAYKSGSKAAEVEVTVSEAAPVATSLKFGADEYTVKVGAKVTVTIEQKDQYGQVDTTPGFLSVDATVAKVTTGFELEGVKQGVVTATYVTQNGLTATTSIVVNNN